MSYFNYDVSETNKNITKEYINKMKEKNRVRVTDSDLKMMITESIKKVLGGDLKKEIRLAQKELYQMRRNLSSIGLRLENTKFYSQYEKMKDEMVRLNNQLIDHIRKTNDREKTV